MQVLSQTPSVMGLALHDEKASYASHTTVEVTETSAMDVMETSTKILSIVFEYALNKFAESTEQPASGTPKFLAVIDKFVAADRQVEMCLPAFPFKSANKVYKVLGTLPDKSEELALERLNTMCLRIGEVYGPGAKVTIISDGLVYNG
jgi:pyoverdine/dityrosine biosynthesis protein Dit1